MIKPRQVLFAALAFETIFISVVLYCVFDYYHSKLYSPNDLAAHVFKRHGDLDLLSNGFYYRGSDANFHYFIEWRTPGASEYYKVDRHQLAVPTEFSLTTDRQKWIFCASWFSKNDNNNAHPSSP